MSVYSIVCLYRKRSKETLNYPDWKLNSKGVFLVKSYYLYLAKGEKSHCAILIEIALGAFTPRMAFFAREVTRECTLTMDNLIKKGIVIVDRCYLCKRHAKSGNHLLLWCYFSYRHCSIVF